MDITLLEDMKETVKKHLPAAMAGELKNYMEIAEANKRQLDIERVKVSDRDQKIKDNTALIVEQREKISLAGDLDRRRDELEKYSHSLDDRQRGFENELLRKELDGERFIRSEVREIVKDVFRSPVYTKTLTKTSPVVQTTYTQEYQNGEYKNTPSGSFITNETETEIETTTKD